MPRGCPPRTPCRCPRCPGTAARRADVVAVRDGQVAVRLRLTGGGGAGAVAVGRGGEMRRAECQEAHRAADRRQHLATALGVVPVPVVAVVVDVDRPHPRSLARGVRDRHLGPEEEAELDDRDHDEEDREQDERELDHRLAAGDRLAGAQQEPASPPGAGRCVASEGSRRGHIGLPSVGSGHRFSL